MKKVSFGKIILISTYSILLVLFIWNWIREYYSFVEFHAMHSGYDTYSFTSIMVTIAITNVFRFAIFSLPIGIGILLRGRIGWILLTSYLYFFIVNIIIQRFEKETLLHQVSWSFSIIGLIIIGGIIFLMSKSKIIQDFHKITHLNKISLNLKAFGIGLIFSLLLVIWKNYMPQHWL